MPTRFLTILCGAVFAWALLFAGIAAAQEDTTEETTALAADAANHRVEAKTSNTSVEVDNGKVSAKTSNGSSSGDTTSQQSSLTVQQTQTDEGRGSRANTGDVNVAQNSSCENPVQRATLNEEDADGSASFTTEGKKFRVTYDVTFGSDAPAAKEFSIQINRNGTEVKSVETKDDVTNRTFFVSEGSDTYKLVATLSNEGTGTTFDVTVDDCVGTDNDGTQRHRDRNRHRDHDRDRDRGAADQQYSRVEEEVIKDTIPNKGRLAATGGVPLVGVAFLALASVGLGLSILRFAIRRGP